MLEKLVLALPAPTQVHVISLTTLGDVGPRLQAHRVDVHALGMQPGSPSPRAFWRLVLLLRRLRPDLVHTWMYHADLLGGLAARLAGIRAVMWGVRHSNLDPSANKPSTMAVMRLCALLSSWVPARIACNAERARQAHVQAGYDAAKMVVIPNGFDVRRFKPDALARDSVRAELGLAPDTALVGVIGRFDQQKNHRGFMQALAGLLQLRPDVHVLLAGHGIDAANAELAGWMAAAGVTPACHLLGRRDDVPRLMAALDVLALPSLGEAFPNVLGESMACGVPCAVTDVGDAADIVGGLGRVVPPGDMPGLAVAMAGLLALSGAERQALALRSQAAVSERFALDVVARRYVAEYRSLLQRA
jgi:glycosyltransferase involved in cell wall biosynthesis